MLHRGASCISSFGIYIAPELLFNCLFVFASLFIFILLYYVKVYGALSILLMSITDSGLGSGMESEVFGLFFLSMTLPQLLLGPAPPVESFLNVLPGFLSC